MKKIEKKYALLSLIDKTKYENGYRYFLKDDFIYKNNTSRIEIIDVYGYRFERTYASLIKILNENKRMSIFSKNKYKLHNMKIFFNLNCRGYKFIGIEKGKPNYIHFYCNHNHKTKRPVSEVLNMKNNFCPKCNKRTITKDIVLKEFNERGYTVDEFKTDFIGAKTIVYYHCEKHGEKTITYDSFNNGVGCMDCGREKTIKALKYSYSDFIRDYNKLNIVKFSLVKPKEEYNNTRTQLTLECSLCKGVFKLGVHNILKNKIYCPHCEVFGVNSRNWRGGISPLHKYLRENISEWKNESMALSNYRCILTHDNFRDIHHKRSFNLILEEVLQITKLPVYSDISTYTQNELGLLRNTCKSLHKKYGAGVCLSESIHKLYHKTYGYGNNTINSWNEFEQDFKNGKYTKGIDY